MAEETDTFTAEERAAMKERAKELKSTKGLKAEEKAAKEAAAVDEAIAALTDDDRALAEQIHAIVQDVAPTLSPKTYYGMPGYAQDGKVLVFFQSAAKFKTRYSTVGFNDSAQLDDGNVWPTSYAITKLTAADAKKLGELIAKAVG
jgi:uncharacterized protein YdhG (YjbR/CyaY superfamily)